ncbi:uncharacterized protein CcaverHIS019_0700540 [Cutaneotrichosporon cavernicola]|uniref:Ricin B lectin domain-containing protein n=1 Tax=Cutaneotrichosporon cavernicola TaxID=279322 RepID=A0AA48L9J4_9TREE|nr:uncharacterized protein CcaverHIS019_0700540 [Cutaneotrichosporon cavernicola]BEI94482.1 hypothetical protein CcaverHIS019_0700540 [Cutaneotrichosporon cavernicola]
MLLHYVLLSLGLVSAGPIAPAAPAAPPPPPGTPEPSTIRHSIFMDQIPVGYNQNVFLKMQSYDMTAQLAYHNGDKPMASTLLRARNNHYYWGISDGETTLVTTDDYNSRFCLDAGAQPAGGNLVHVWQCSPGVTQQTWVFNGQYVPDTDRKVGPIKLRDFDLCLDRNGGQPKVAKCSGSSDQTWAVKTWEA